MPLGFERLNERTQRPNPNINFIKPLASSSPEDQKIAKDFLERIAAQCYPVMKMEHISVMALEEHAPNPEFLGRNFNAGECIQLVLKDKAGRWLSFRFVQMVMMHELAHCKQMNHSRFFWQVRNRYAEHMKELWVKKYEGEGLWGRGQNLDSGSFIHNRMPDSADIPEHLCGGTYRRARGKKRKRGHEDAARPSYAERQQKRIAKKFGAHGEGHELGEDELFRGALERGHRHPGKPRVAKSKRGRELRANAALARFDAAKEQQRNELENTPDLEDDDGSETEFSDDDFADGLPILDTLEKIKDQKGRDLYKVCGDEGDHEEGGQTELDELRLISADGFEAVTDRSASISNGATTKVIKGGREGAQTNNAELTLSGPMDKPSRAPGDDSETESEPEVSEESSVKELVVEDSRPKDRADREKPIEQFPAASRPATRTGQTTQTGQTTTTGRTTTTEPITNWAWPANIASNLVACPICSLENEPDSPTCIACSHVLKTSLMPNHWRCKSDQCQGTMYINASDVGRCGLCGSQKPAVTTTRPMGVVGADVLRWD